MINPVSTNQLKQELLEISVLLNISSMEIYLINLKPNADETLSNKLGFAEKAWDNITSIIVNSPKQLTKSQQNEITSTVEFFCWNNCLTASNDELNIAYTELINKTNKFSYFVKKVIEHRITGNKIKTNFPHDIVNNQKINA